MFLGASLSRGKNIQSIFEIQTKYPYQITYFLCAEKIKCLQVQSRKSLSHCQDKANQLSLVGTSIPISIEGK